MKGRFWGKKSRTSKYERGQPRPAPLNLEAAQLCLQNARRLMEDSHRVSTPTETALLELAVEEASKGWAIALKFVEENVRKAADVELRVTGIRREPAPQVKRIREQISSLDTNRLFDLHVTKLAALNIVLDLLEVSFSGMKTEDFSEEDLDELYGIAFRPMDPKLPKHAEVLINLIRSYRQKVERLAELKNRGIYVARSEGGVVLSPATVSHPSDDMRTLALLVTENLASYILSVGGNVKGMTSEAEFERSLRDRSSP
jgi:hypothetical protein